LRDDAGNIYYYVFNEGSALTEHKVSGNTYTSRKIERVACDNAVTCAIEYPQPLSPDGKQLILEDIKDGEKGGFSYYLLDLSSGKTNKLWDFKDSSIQAGWAFWSP